ncbi:DUF2793 domain-containing protein, partial [Paraburkholderia aspalathi]|nr:DUF2793 domain-containing protein [Paraburkholderia aspalathi]
MICLKNVEYRHEKGRAVEKTDKLNLPYIMPQQAQKHVTHNEAIRALDAIIHLSVIDRFITNPPVNPAPGDRYIVANNGGGAWAGMAGKVAAWQDEGWYFYSPQPGWRVWITGESALLVWSGSEWLSPFASFPSIAINTGDDANNRLSAKLRSALFSHEDSGSGDVRVTINKATAGDTATLIFQTGFSGRAEFGLAGDDDWQIKVSPQGGDWYNALK